jgi:ferredoxin-NADP reductase
MKEFTVRLNWAEKVTPNILHLAFSKADGDALDFIPGQFVTFLLDSADGVKRRSYSIASIPGKTTETEIAISYQKNGVASEAFFNLKAGETLTCSGPFGRLILREGETPARYILVATGTGVAPYRAMLPQIAERLNNDTNLEVILLLGVQYRDDLLYGEDFLTFSNSHPRFKFMAFFSREELDDAKDHENKGYVQSAFENLALDPDEDLVYLCGNPNMIDDAFEWLTDEGFSPKAVRREKYISSN